VPTSTAPPRTGTTPGHPPDVTTPPASASTTSPASPYAIDVGDCFGTVDGTGAGGEVDAVQIVPCEVPHLYEAFHEAEVPVPEQVPFPGEEVMLEVATEECTGDAFAAFVGTPYDRATELAVQPLVPTAQSWAGGDRTITCALAPADGLARAGSVAGR
jgi:hypothetical protein